MTGLLVHALIGLLTIGIFFWANAHLYRKDWPGAAISGLEGLYYVLAVGSVCAGWYFNTKYMFEYPAEGSWKHFTIRMACTCFVISAWGRWWDSCSCWPSANTRRG